MASQRFYSQGFFVFPDQLRIYKHIGQRHPGNSVVDVGCGIGIGSGILAASGCMVRGIELVEQNVNAAAALFPLVRFEVCDVRHSCPPADVVAAIEVIEHMERPEQAIRNMLASAGERLFLSTPNRLADGFSRSGPPNNGYHVREFSPREILDHLPERTVLRDWGSWEEVGADSTITPMVYEIET